MRNKIWIAVFLLSLFVPVHSIFATPYFTTSIKPASKYIGSTWTPLQPVNFTFTNPYAPLGSQFNPINTRLSGTSGFNNPYANLGTQFNPIFIRPNNTYSFTNSYAPLGTQFNPINFR